MSIAASQPVERVLEVLGDRAVIKTAGSDTDGRFALVEITSPKGGGPPPHRHPWREGYWVLEGELEFVVEGRKRTLTAGSWLLVQNGVAHTLKVLSETARYLLLAEPAGVELFFINLEKGTADDPSNLAKIVQIAGEHGIELVT